MTDDQRYNREERLAIMTICGDGFETEAQSYCDSKPDIYGAPALDVDQLDLNFGG